MTNSSIFGISWVGVSGSPSACIASRSFWSRVECMSMSVQTERGTSTYSKAFTMTSIIADVWLRRVCLFAVLLPSTDSLSLTEYA